MAASSSLLPWFVYAGCACMARLLTMRLSVWNCIHQRMTSVRLSLSHAARARDDVGRDRGAGDGSLQCRAVEWVKLELEPMRFLEQGRVFDRCGECLAQHHHAFDRYARWGGERAADGRRRGEQGEQRLVLIRPGKVDHIRNVRELRVLIGARLQQQTDLPVAQELLGLDLEHRPGL